MTKFSLFTATVILFVFLFSACKKDGEAAPSFKTYTEGNFTIPFQSPAVVGGQTTLTAQVTTQNIFGAKLSKVLGYQSGSILGPTIVVNSGDLMNVHIQNNLSDMSNVHWHGLVIPAAMDGGPELPILPGASFNSTFTVAQRASMYWYHPHAHGHTGEQAYLGLGGGLIVRDAEENSLKLPAGEFELPFILQDKRKTDDYSLVYNPTSVEKITGFMGKYVTVNGVYTPFKNVKTATYRLRLLNGSNAQLFNLALSDGSSFTLIGTDGGLLTAPVSLSSLLLGPGERADVLVNFSSYPVGTELYLVNKLFSAGVIQGKSAFNIAKFVVDTKVTDNFVLADKLSDITPIPESSAIKTRSFVMSDNPDYENTGFGMHLINGVLYDKNIINETVKAGTTEIWEFDASGDDDIHPFHIHGVQFQILDHVGGRGVLIPSEHGWKDTFMLLPHEKVRVIMTFSQNKGIYVVHCHNLEHEGEGMMLQFAVQ